MTTSIQDQLSALAESAGFLMKLPALRAKMGGVEYYVITLPLSAVARYVTTTDPNLPVKQRENRKASPSRYREIAEYIRNNPDDYRFSALTCTYGKNGTGQPLGWEPAAQTGPGAGIGMLTLDQRDPLIIVDGQHRFGAIRQVIEDDPSFAEEMITIVLFPYLQVESAQQLFSDLNRTARKTNKSLDILFDHRDQINRIVQRVVESCRFFGERVNLEDASVPTNSSQVFTLAGVYQASKPIILAAMPAGLIAESLNSENETEYEDFLLETWDFVGSHFPEWGKVANNEIEIRDVRQQYVHWHSGVISTVGEFVAACMRESGVNWKSLVTKALAHPSTQDWRRDAGEWQEMIVSGNVVLPRSLVRMQLGPYLKHLASLNLTKREQEYIENVERKRRELGMEGIL